MSDVNPVLDTQIVGVPRVIWQGASTAATVNPYTLRGQLGLNGSLQVTGDFGGGTVTMEVSNDGTNWEPLLEFEGGPLAFSATGMLEFSTSAAYIRPNVAGGTEDSLNIILVLRGAPSV